MNLRLTKTAVNRDGVHGMAVELYGDGVKLAGADLRLPADDAAVKVIVDVLRRQAEAVGVKIVGRRLIGITHAIEMGSVQ